MDDATRFAISQSFLTYQAKIPSTEMMNSLISAYIIYMKAKVEDGATEDERKLMENELSAIYTTSDICHKLSDWLNS